MKLKTFRVARLLDIVNKKNRTSTCSPEMRSGWNSLLEEILMESNNYAGFGYLSEKDVPPGQLPGIAPAKEVINGIANHFPDETRRIYYLNIR